MSLDLQESTQPIPGAISRPATAAGAVRFACLLPALATAVFLYLCYFPVAWGWLAWVALVPLLSLVRSARRPRNIYLAAWVSGLAFFWPVLQWMRVADHRMYATWAMLATYCSVYFPAAVWLMRSLDRKTPLPLVVTVPTAWVALEFVRSFMLTGFAWYYLGHSQQAVLPLIQISDLGGAYAVSFLVAAVNAWLFSLAYQLPAIRTWLDLAPPARPRWTGVAAEGFVLSGLIVATLWYGMWRLEQNDFRPGPRLALLQTNLDIRLRNEATDARKEASAVTIQKHVAQLSRLAFLAGPPDLIVWPETSFPLPRVEISDAVPLDRVPADLKDSAAYFTEVMRDQWLKVFPATQLFGLNQLVVDDDGREQRYNSALLIHANGKTGERYDKIHRVPFGEYVPFRGWLPFMDALAPYDYDYSIRPGEHLTRLRLGKHTFGALICFEDTDPFLARQYGRQHVDGPPVDFLVNISNDGWFDGTSEHEEHLAISRFRAIEARRALVRSVNMGVSAVIDGNGRVLKPEKIRDEGDMLVWRATTTGPQAAELDQGHWADYKKVAGVLLASVPIDERTSLYALWGDWLPGLCWLVIVVALVASWRKFSIASWTRGRPA